MQPDQSDARTSKPTPGEGERGTPGGQPQEKVENRPNVGTVSPDEYPQDRPDR